MAQQFRAGRKNLGGKIFYMIRQFLLFLSLTAGPAIAETYMFTESPCLPGAEAVKQFSSIYQEDPLFSGIGFAMVLTPYSKDSIPVNGPVFFTVNQTTSTWSLFFAPDLDTLCLIASGTGFEPQ